MNRRHAPRLILFLFVLVLGACTISHVEPPPPPPPPPPPLVDASTQTMAGPPHSVILRMESGIPVAYPPVIIINSGDKIRWMSTGGAIEIREDGGTQIPCTQGMQGQRTHTCLSNAFTATDLEDIKYIAYVGGVASEDPSIIVVP